LSIELLLQQKENSDCYIVFGVKKIQHHLKMEDVFFRFFYLLAKKSLREKEHENSYKSINKGNTETTTKKNKINENLSRYFFD